MKIPYNDPPPYLGMLRGGRDSPNWIKIRRFQTFEDSKTQRFQDSNIKPIFEFLQQKTKVVPNEAEYFCEAFGPIFSKFFKLEKPKMEQQHEIQIVGNPSNTKEAIHWLITDRKCQEEADKAIN